MNYSFSISTKHGDEYRIMLFDADITLLADNVRETIVKNDIDISEIMIDRVNGGESTAQEVLHAGISNTPIIIKGEGYTQFMHLIAREKHQHIVDIIKQDVVLGWGK